MEITRSQFILNSTGIKKGEKCGIVYKLINTVNSKFYIGSTIHPFNRLFKHFSLLKTNKHTNRYLQKAYNKYGFPAFKIEIIEQNLDFSKVLEREQYYIDQLNPQYNLAKKVQSSLGIVWSKESKKKFSKLKMGVKLSPEHCTALKENAWLKGKFGADNYKSKKVFQYTLVGKFVAEYACTRIAAEKTKCLRKNIQNTCLGKQLTHAKFIWLYNPKDLEYRVSQVSYKLLKIITKSPHRKYGGS